MLWLPVGRSIPGALTRLIRTHPHTFRTISKTRFCLNYPVRMVSQNSKSFLIYTVVFSPNSLLFSNPPYLLGWSITPLLPDVWVICLCRIVSISCCHSLSWESMLCLRVYFVWLSRKQNFNRLLKLWTKNLLKKNWAKWLEQQMLDPLIRSAKGNIWNCIFVCHWKRNITVWKNH